MSRGRGFWITNHLANPILRRLLRGPLGPRLGRRLGVVRYRGRRTGEMHELVVQYVRDGDRVLIVPGEPERKRWWRNLLPPQQVELLLAGMQLRGVAKVVRRPDHPADMQMALAAYRTVFPRAAETSVIVQIDLSDADANAVTSPSPSWALAPPAPSDPNPAPTGAVEPQRNARH